MADERRSKRSSGTALRFFGKRKTEKERRENSRIRKVRKTVLGCGEGPERGKNEDHVLGELTQGKKERGGGGRGKKRSIQVRDSTQTKNPFDF